MLLPNIVMVPYAVHKHSEGLEYPVGLAAIRGSCQR
jgi:hypothetical protein